MLCQRISWQCYAETDARTLKEKHNIPTLILNRSAFFVVEIWWVCTSACLRAAVIYGYLCNPPLVHKDAYMQFSKSISLAVEVCMKQRCFKT